MIALAASQPNADEAIVEVYDACKSFGSLIAVDHVDLRLIRGEVLGLIGPNGSGKTTLVNLISGALKLDYGRVRLGEHDASRWSAQKRCHWGLARTSQIARPMAEMTVLENVMVAALFGSATPISMRTALERAELSVNDVRLGAVAKALPSELPVQQLKLLELARALASDPVVVLLDEVIAGLTSGEASAVLDLVHRKREEGTAFLFIEHRIPELMGIADRVTVLSEGRVLTSGTPTEVVEDPRVLQTYFGTDLVTEAS